MTGDDSPNEGTPNLKVTSGPKEVPKSSKGKEKQASPDPIDEKLYIDRASSDHGSGAGLILIDTEGVEYSYALRLNFNNSNNDISHIPREKNKKVDALSKLAAVQCKGLTKRVLVEELNEWSVDVVEVNVVVEEEGKTWMAPIREYIENETL
ncbi:hypothetical protein Tco_1158857 [Tanacetum coccineum]